MPNRQTLAAIDWETIEDSSNVHSVYFHEPTDTICVRFNGGGLYTYMITGRDDLGNPHEIYASLRHANSVGGYLHRVVKAFPYTRFANESELLNHLNV